mgnify:CR=1 FL=1
MPHPSWWLTRRAQWIAFGLTTVLSLVVMFTLVSSGGALRTDAAPQGIVTYELAGDGASMQSVLDSWDADTKVAAAFNLGLDYLYLCVYSTSIALGCTLVATAGKAGRHFLTLPGIVLAWLQFAAAGLDALENYALLQMLTGPVTAPLTAMAWWCAVPKFIIVAVGIVYALGGLAVVGVVRLVRG